MNDRHNENGSIDRTAAEIRTQKIDDATARRYVRGPHGNRGTPEGFQGFAGEAVERGDSESVGGGRLREG